MRVAIVHDWLYILGGAEKVLASILRCFPGADLYTLFDLLSTQDRAVMGYVSSRTSFLQYFPGIGKHHRLCLPFLPYAVEQFNLSAYDLVLSSSHAVAKSVITGPAQLHISYIHTPMRYAWDMQHSYLREAKLESGLKGILARRLLSKMRDWDAHSAYRADTYIANSHFVARRIKKAYGREAHVIYPPVEISQTLAVRTPESSPYFLAASRLVPYKNMHVIVEAFARMPDKKLRIAGVGPQLNDLKRIAPPNVEFLGFVATDELRRLMRNASAFVFAAEEDFGIVPVEAQAEGTPVIALGRGGARETVVALGTHTSNGPAPTGVLFDVPEAGYIVAAVDTFLGHRTRFERSACHANAMRFSESRFATEFSAFVEREYDAFRSTY